MNGILIVDKPQGWTSHDVVNFVRRRFQLKKVGHAGTLDPMATGILVLLLGGATSLSDQYMNSSKEYKAVLTLGKITDTADATGKVIKTEIIPELKRVDVENVLKGFIGEIEQVPPMVSAIKFQGQRLYKLARQGNVVERQPRKITIADIELTSFTLPDIAISVICNKGTYIRTLCEDIAKALGSCGHMSYLRRTKSGGFSIEQAIDIEKLKNIPAGDLNNFIINN